MESGSSFTAKTPVFNGHNYPVWSIKMKAYLRAFNLWEVVETDQQPPPLRQNPTLAQIKQHTEEVTKRMNESETVKEFLDRIMKIVNRIILLDDEELSDKRVVEKVLRKALRSESNVEGALSTTEKGKSQQKEGAKKQFFYKKWKEKEEFQRDFKGGLVFSAGLVSNLVMLKSGCTHHMTPNESCFKSLDKSFTSKVRLGNGELVEVKGKGVAIVDTPTGIKLIYDVLFVPEISYNLISVAQLVENKYSLHFHDKLCDVFDEFGNLLLSVKMLDRSFPIEWKETQIKACSMVSGMPLVHVDEHVCKVCQLGKQSQLPFPSGQAHKASMKLQLVHTDICGPMKTASLSGNRYFLIFIDDFSRFCWVYFLKHKSEVFDVFIKFKASVENECGLNIKTLRFDNATEYTSHRFQQFLQQHGIHHQLTIPYTPQQNGVSERKNRSILNMARCLLFEKNLPKNCWAEAIYTAVHLQNRLPTKAIEGKTPFEAWLGNKPAVDHLKVFGCICYAFIPDEKRGKLDERANTCVFIGYSLQSKVTDSNQVAKLNDKPELEADFDDAANESDLIDDAPVRGTRTVEDIYSRCNLSTVEPSNYYEAANSDAWRVAMKEELKMIEKNDTWTLVDKPKNKNIISVKWVYRVKMNYDGTINKYKARLVVKGYSQLAGIDFTETFAPIARHETIRLLLALAADKGWSVFHLDVKSAFLNGKLEEEIFVEQPEGFVQDGAENKVYLLKKALYGLKQAPRAWNCKIDDHLLSLGFEKSLKIDQSSKGIFICQRNFTSEILSKFAMSNYRPVSIPSVSGVKYKAIDGSTNVDVRVYRSMIGNLLYLSTTRLDIMHAVSLLSRFMHSPIEVHLKGVKRIFRYLKATAGFGVFYPRAEKIKLLGFCDNDWARSEDDMKSTTGFCFTLGSRVISWCSQKQDAIAHSTAEAEYIVAAIVVDQAIWLRKLLVDVHHAQSNPTEMLCDSKAAIAIAKNPIFHGKTKHFKLKYHIVRVAENDGDIVMVHCSSAMLLIFSLRAYRRSDLKLLETSLAFAAWMPRKSVE
ncbi:hypothetical protein SLEP1_g44285 [Rubroshorea leprosula]|uniref:Integrase catalytic domain-containing protein n=1 Tax=Rubroshorea leprosula TaxID=152421 RepID=A0AAV5LHK3_9ROSI|nr:hypothetical protein SLEP1_g44285 [Rubroshorea leprosula]